MVIYKRAENYAKLRRGGTSMSKLSPNWHLSLGSEVSMASTHVQERCCSCSDWDRLTTVCLSDWTRPRWTLLSHTFHGVYLTWRLPESWFIREAMTRSITRELLSLTTPLSRRSLARGGIICVKDLIHEIFTVGPNFKYASSFLWQFMLSSPLGWLWLQGHQDWCPSLTDELREWNRISKTYSDYSCD